jgi:hypothetical protein
MHRTTFIPLVAWAVVLASPAGLARAGDGAKDEPVPLALAVGESAPICRTGTITCPARDPICDDASIAAGAVTDEGLVFTALKPGTTLCSAASASGSGPRRVYRITVKPKPKA